MTGCYEDVYIYQSNNGGCDSGPNGICSSAAGAAPFVVPAGNGNPSVLALGLVANGEGTSTKISKTTAFNTGELQFEYTVNESGTVGIFWDISELDGAGAGLVGTPFAGDNVKVTPTGDGASVNTCNTIRCAANQPCAGAFTDPNEDEDVHFCPLDTGVIWVDLCEPTAQFNTRSIKFSA
jgi:hypothetical protein